MAKSRTVLFLYPDLEDDNLIEQNIISKIISDLKIIINTSNRNIRKILQDGSFSYIKCLPYIEMEEANKKPTIRMVELVRVCVIGYNEKNYEDVYSDICEKYLNNTLNISHLIGLKINTDLKAIKFTKPEESSFDVIIESNLNDLESILISIMLDTSIYHYFSLNNDIEYRKNFSQIKINGIKSSKYVDYYGNDIDLSNIKYLPFSYPYVKKYFELQSENSNQEREKIISELITAYFTFIKQYVCKAIDYNRRKEPKRPYDIEADNIMAALDIIIKDPIFEVGNTYIVAVKNSFVEGQSISINKDNVVYVIKDYENTITEWLSLFANPLNNFSLFFIKIGD